MSDLQQTADPGYQALVDRISVIYARGQLQAHRAVNEHLTQTFWQIGQDIVEYEQGGQARATYRQALIINLSRDLRLRHGKGFSRSNVIRARQFYLGYPKGATLSHFLNWSHVIELLKLDDPLERSFYEMQCAREKWTVRELQRQIKSSLFLRLAANRNTTDIVKLATDGLTVSQPEDLLRDSAKLGQAINANLQDWVSPTKRSQKETPGPLNRKRSRKGSQSQRLQGAIAVRVCQNSFLAADRRASTPRPMISPFFQQIESILHHDRQASTSLAYTMNLTPFYTPSPPHPIAAPHAPIGSVFSTKGAAHTSPGQRPGYASSFHQALKGRPNRCPAPSGLGMFLAIEPRALPWAGILCPFGASVWPTQFVGSEKREQAINADRRGLGYGE